ncbi:MAG: 2-amino-4-hydroxy-6-hydroxymethyldihydropteridine diphosphokinase [Terriglobales bacterium]|jgi:2-amino-4-hydroxy-6-hydroxymethyldihydropteridine diphosphokinase
MKKTVYLSLGSNSGNRERNLRQAVECLGPLGKVMEVSPIYETEPVGVGPQRWYLNCAVALRTELGPRQLLIRTRQIEKELGRRRMVSIASERKRPRPIDIDILLLGKVVLDSLKLVIPHPAMHQRRFVLEPLAEIAPRVRHPLLKSSVRQMRDAVQTESQSTRRFKNAFV